MVGDGSILIISEILFNVGGSPHTADIIGTGKRRGLHKGAGKPPKPGFIESIGG